MTTLDSKGNFTPTALLQLLCLYIYIQNNQQFFLTINYLILLFNQDSWFTAAKNPEDCYSWHDVHVSIHYSQRLNTLTKGPCRLVFWLAYFLSDQIQNNI